MRALAAGYAPILSRLRPSTRHVAVIADVPLPPLGCPRLRRGRRCRTSCTAPSRATRPWHALAGSAAVARVRGVEVIDPTDRFCLATLCPAVIGNVLVYRRTGHMTATYAATLAPWLDERLP